MSFWTERGLRGVEEALPSPTLDRVMLLCVGGPWSDCPGAPSAAAGGALPEGESAEGAV